MGLHAAHRPFPQAPPTGGTARAEVSSCPAEGTRTEHWALAWLRERGERQAVLSSCLASLVWAQPHVLSGTWSLQVPPASRIPAWKCCGVAAPALHPTGTALCLTLCSAQLHLQGPATPRGLLPGAFRHSPAPHVSPTTFQAGRSSPPGSDHRTLERARAAHRQGAVGGGHCHRVCLSVSVVTWKMGTLTEPASQGSLQD